MSDKPTEGSLSQSEISRRDLLSRAGRVGAGAVIAGAFAGPAGDVGTINTFDALPQVV